jgi:hypothetical protein
MGTVWVLALILRIGPSEIIIKPRLIYNDDQFSYYECMANKENWSKNSDIPATCYRQEMGI